MNKVILMGRLTKAPEIKYLQDDNKTAMVRYTLAVDRRYGKNREREEHFFAESKKASDTDPKDEKDGFMSVPEDAELPFE